MMLALGLASVMAFLFVIVTVLVVLLRYVTGFQSIPGL